MKADPIQEFIIETERNMRIASAVADGYAKAREQIVGAFLDRLGDALLKELKGWQCDRWHKFFVDSEAYFMVFKPEWSGYRLVSLACIDHGETVKFGISRNEDLGKKPFQAEILNAVKEVFPPARAKRWWEAFMIMQSPAADWRKPEALFRMHTDTRFLDEVAEQLLVVAKAAAPIIDRGARTK